MSRNYTPYEALELAVSLAGSQSELARQLGVSQPTVWTWLQSSKRLPADHVLTVERLYGISRHDLRPEIYPRNLGPAPESPRVYDIDQGGEDRFCGIDRNIARRHPVEKMRQNLRAAS